MPSVTFAVVGRDEEELLAGVLEQARAAADGGDEVWFVDSESSDGSAGLAASLGARVVQAPAGKGRAMSRALELCRTERICFVDADVRRSSVNIPLTLKQAAAETGADMVVGEFEWEGRRRSVTPGIYRPLVSALFPDAIDRFGRRPMSGFRVIKTSLPVTPLPDGYGVETHLNLVAAATGMATAVVPLGPYLGTVRGPGMVAGLGADVAVAILDLAERFGRLDPELRPRWDEWVADVLAAIRSEPELYSPNGDHQRELTDVAARPLPPVRLSTAP